MIHLHTMSFRILHFIDTFRYLLFTSLSGVQNDEPNTYRDSDF